MVKKLIRKFFPKNKKGSHIEFIISFAVFIAFIMFMYMLTRPAIVTEIDSEELIDFLKPRIQDEISENLSFISVKVSEDFRGDCIRIDNFEKDYLNNKKYNITARNSEEIIKTSGNEKIFVESNSEDFFKIYYSKSNLTREKVGDYCETVGEKKGKNYTIGLHRTEKIVSLGKFNEVYDEYNNSYGSLKNNIGFPQSNDFGFGIHLNNGTIIRTKEKDIQTNIYAEIFPIRYFNKKAEIKTGYLEVRVW